MKPDSAVIYFTVASGVGYGMIVVLSILFLTNELNYIINAKIIISILSLFLVSSGLLASTKHLSHPERAWHALSQWRTSWLSREGLFAIIAFFPILTFYYLWIFQYNSNLIYFFIMISSLLSILTVYCTSKIYASLKTEPAWHNPLVPIIYILNSIVSGSLVIFLIFFYYNIYNLVLTNLIVIILPSTLFIKLLYWYSIRLKKTSNTRSALNLGKNNKVSFFEGPHTGENYLTTEMINKIDRIKSISYRSVFCILTYVTPVYCIIQEPYLVVSHKISLITFCLTTIMAIFGMFIERWLFFIESQHSVSLYYGNNAV